MAYRNIIPKEVALKQYREMTEAERAMFVVPEEERVDFPENWMQMSEGEQRKFLLENLDAALWDWPDQHGIADNRARGISDEETVEELLMDMFPSFPYPKL